MDGTRTLATECRPIGDLIHYARNVRTHDESQVALISIVCSVGRLLLWPDQPTWLRSSPKPPAQSGGGAVVPLFQMCFDSMPDYPGDCPVSQGSLAPATDSVT